MELLIDHADIAAIKRIIDLYPVDGVTTNPSILAGAGRPPFEVLKEIRSIIGSEAPLHVQAVAKDTAGMILDAERIVKELPGNTFVKIPSVPAGFKAIRLLTEKGIQTTGTAIYTPLQAFLAAKAGAAYAAPYVNRIDNMGYDGVKITCEIHDIFEKNALPAKVLAASFKNSEQLLKLAMHGVGAATAAPDVIEGLTKNPAIDAAVDAFIDDFRSLTGKDAMSAL